jgi:hypothetical protein
MTTANTRSKRKSIIMRRLSDKLVKKNNSKKKGKTAVANNKKNVNNKKVKAIGKVRAQNYTQEEKINSEDEDEATFHY